MLSRHKVGEDRAPRTLATALTRQSGGGTSSSNRASRATGISGRHIYYPEVRGVHGAYERSIVWADPTASVLPNATSNTA